MKRIKVDFSWFRGQNSGWKNKDLGIAANRIEELFAPIGDCWIVGLDHDACTATLEVPRDFDNQRIKDAFPVEVEDV
ncbi:MAG: hypothetical protein Q7S19_00665 [bacterium]|nr:hypothetical protein [bacterium]